tara:strand:- start:7 stop:486 length:480 start_codon:yes stop_codon:yes gene_type:complete
MWNWLKKLWPGKSIMSMNPQANVNRKFNPGYMASNPTQSGTVGNPMAAIGEVGYINPVGSVSQKGRPSVGMGASPSQGIASFSETASGLDKDFWSALGGSMGSGTGSTPTAPGAVSLGGGNARFKAIGGQGLPVSDMAPNPGWEEVLPKKRRDRYSGGF